MSTSFESFLKAGRRRGLTLIAIGMAACGCSSSGSRTPLPEQDVQFAQAASAAGVAFENGDLETAVQLYDRALARGRAMDDSRSVADTAYNLAACEILLNRYDAALNYLQEAKYNSTANPSAAERIQLLTAKLAYLQQRNAEAQRIAESLREANDPQVQLQARVLRTLIACDLGNAADAKAELSQLRAAAAQATDASAATKADIEKAEGFVAFLDKQTSAAADHFDRETALLRSARRYRDVIRSLSRAGAAHRDAGAFAAAADRFYRAARGCLALNDRGKAKEFVDQASAAAKSAGDAELASLIDRLSAEISSTPAP